MSGGFHGSGWGLSDAAPPADGALGLGEADRYSVAGLLGSGGMGVVEVVFDARLGRQVARKQPGDHVDPALGAAWLTHEARVAARLDHPNVVPVLDAGVSADGRPFVTMPLLPSETLAGRIRSAEPLDRLVQALLAASRGVAHAHARSVVHGDLKPDNVLVGEAGETWVADWGMAHDLGPAPLAPPVDAGSLPSPWRAPELGQVPMDPAVDVFALGAILTAILERVDDSALRAVASRACATSPGARYPHGGAFADELQRWLEGRRVLAHAYTPRELAGLFVAAWRGPLLVAALTLAVVGAVVVVAGVRTARERDRALAAEASLRDTNGSLWTDRASAALAASQDLEAARAAREALALRDHPEARGVALLARSDLVAGPVGGAPCPRWVRPAPGGWLCGERDGVSLRDASGGVVRRWPVLAHDALFDGERILALTDGKVVDLVAPDAPPAYRGPATHGLQPGGLLADRTDWWDLRDPSRAPIRPCPPPETHDGTLRVGDGGYAACSGGQLVEIVGTTRRVVPTEAAVLARVNELAMGADGLLWLGSLDGEVRAVRADDGRLVGAVDAGVGALRRLLPGAPWGVAVGQDGRARLVDPGEQRLGPALPVPGVLDVGWDGERLLVATREGFTEVLGVAEASASRWFAPSGVASVDLGADRVAVGLSGMVEVRTWPGGQRVRRASPQAAMVKAVALDGDGVVAASVDDAGARVRLALDGSPDEAFDEVRRLRRLVRGGDGTLLGVPYVASLWRAPPGEAPTVSAAPAMLVDVVAAGAWAWGLDADGRRWSVRLADGAMSPVAEPDAPPARVLAVSPDGSTLATLSSRGVAVGAPDGPAREVLEAADLTAVDVGPHGLLLGFLDGRVGAWGLDGVPRWWVRAHGERVSGVRWASDGGAVSVGWDGQVRRYPSPSVGTT